MAVSTTVMSAHERGESVAGRLEELFDNHHERLFRLARRLSRDSEQARDLVQETFLRAARRPGSIPPDRSRAAAWLVRVLINLSRDQRRRDRVRGVKAPIPAGRAGEPGAEDAVVARATVQKALASLSPRRRAVVVLRELEDVPVKEIARMLGVAQVTVRWHLASARKRLAELLLTPGGDEEKGR